VKLIKEIYEYVWPKDNKTTARIIKEQPNKFGVEYINLPDLNNQDDWQFLHDLSEEVLKMYGEQKIDPELVKRAFSGPNLNQERCYHKEIINDHASLDKLCVKCGLRFNAEVINDI